MQKILIILLTLIGLLFLAIVSVAGCLFFRLPLYASVFIFCGIIAGFYLFKWLAKTLKIYWRRRYFNRNTKINSHPNKTQAENFSAVLSYTKKYNKTHKEQLPWFVLLGSEGSGKSGLVRRGYISPCTNENTVDSASIDSDGGHCWILEHIAIAEADSKIFTEKPNNAALKCWDWLVEKLHSNRRHIQMQGFMIAVSIDQLTGDQDALAQYAIMLRKKIEGFSRKLGYSYPIYFILTKADKIQGFEDFSSALPEEIQQQAFGQLFNHKDSHIEYKQLITEWANNLASRVNAFNTLQIQLGGTLMPRIFLLEQAIKAIRSPITHFLHAFFRLKAKASQDNPNFRGLFLTSTQQLHDKSLTDKGSVLEGLSVSSLRQPGCQDLFVYHIFSKILPSDHNIKIKLYHRQVVTKHYYQKSLIAWWSIFIGGSVYLGFSYTHAITALMEMGQVAKVRDKQFTNYLSYNLSLMAAINSDIAEIKNTQEKWLFSLWPYSSTMNTIVNNYQQYYVKKFNKYVLPGLTKSLNESADLVMRPEYQQKFGFVVENIVDKVNLIQARLNLMPLSAFRSLHLRELIVDKDFRPNDFRFLYKNYINWNLDVNGLKKQRGQLLDLLDSLAIFDQPFSWLSDWVNQSSDIQAIQLSDYWSVNNSHIIADKIAPIYTEAGYQLMLALFTDMANVQLQPVKFERYRSAFFAEYHTKRYQTWHQFTENFNKGLEYIPSQEAWYALAQRDFFELPYIHHARNLEKNFTQLPLIKPPEWLTLSHQLYQYYQSATLPLISENKDHSWWHNVLAHINRYIKNIEQGHDVYMPHDNLLQAIIGYQKNLLNLQKQVLALNEISAFELVQCLFSNTASANEAISAIQQQFYDAYNNLQQIKFIATKQMSLLNDNQSIWNLYRGMFDLLWYGTIKQATCYIQKQWISSISEGNSLPILTPQTNLAEIFGQQNNVIGQFMEKYIDSFINYNTDKQNYTSKTLFGHKLEFSSWVYAYAKGQQEYRQLALLQTHLESLLKSHDELMQGTIKPTNVNQTATLLPSSTTLAITCDGKKQSFSNYNMLSEFLLTGDIFKCTAATLSIQFIGAHDFSATKKYSGNFEVIKLFYQLFNQGQLTFKETDFPNIYSSLKDYNITDITVLIELFGIDQIKETLAEYIDKREALTTIISEQLVSQHIADIASCWGHPAANKIQSLK